MDKDLKYESLEKRVAALERIISEANKKEVDDILDKVIEDEINCVDFRYQDEFEKHKISLVWWNEHSLIVEGYRNFSIDLDVERLGFYDIDGTHIGECWYYNEAFFSEDEPGIFKRDSSCKQVEEGFYSCGSFPKLSRKGDKLAEFVLDTVNKEFVLRKLPHTVVTYEDCGWDISEDENSNFYFVKE